MPEEKDYNFGTTYTAKLDGFLDLNKFGNVRVGYKHHGIFTIDGIDRADQAIS